MLRRHISIILSVLMLLSAMIAVPAASAASVDSIPAIGTEPESDAPAVDSEPAEAEAELVATGAQNDLAETGAESEAAETGWSIPTETTFVTRLEELKEQYYPDGYSGAYYENGRAMAWQCYGYAVQMLHDVFGINYYEDGFVHKIDYDMDNIYAGDIVRIRWDSHSIFITRVTDEGYYFTDANWDYNNGVRWDAYYTKEEMAATFTYKIHVPGSFLNGSGAAKTGLYADTPVLRNIKCSAPGITVYWNPCEEVAAYRVYCKAGDQPNWKILGDTDKTYYQYIGNLEYGKQYTFTVRALDCYGNLISGFDKEGISVSYHVAPPELTSVKAEVGKTTVSWAGVKSVKWYRVFAKAENENNWRTIGVVNGTSFNYTKGKGKTTYQYTVRCLNSDKQLISGCSINKLSAEYLSHDTQLDAPQNITAGITKTKGVVKVCWNAVHGAKRYLVFKQQIGVDKGWKKLGYTTGTSFNHSGCVNAASYRYTVRCVDEKGAFTSPFIVGPTVQYFDMPTNLKAVKHDDHGGVKISWKAVTGAPAYALYYKTETSGGWQRVDVDGQITANEYIFRECENGVKYTFTVRVCSLKGKNLSTFLSGVSLTYQAPAAADASSEA